jgi:hypothetical protein
MEAFLAFVFANQWLVLLICGALLLALTESGFRMGVGLHEAKDDARKAQIGGVQAAVLGMLGLLLGFTFAMAVGRYESRRQLVVQEANAIGTTYLRASFLPEPHRRAVEDLLRRYVDVRLDFYAAGTDAAKAQAAEQDATRVQRELWAHAVAAGKESPSPLTATFVGALNETIDLDATRLNTLRAHVPGAVWLLLLAVAAAGCFASGYGTGAAGARSLLTTVLLPLLITFVITLVADLDRPRRGLIGISQQPLIDVREALRPGG